MHVCGSQYSFMLALDNIYEFVLFLLMSAIDFRHMYKTLNHTLIKFYFIFWKEEWTGKVT